MRTVGEGERAQRHQRVCGNDLLGRQAEHMGRLPGVDRDQETVLVPQPLRPLAPDQTVVHAREGEFHHRPVLRPVRELLGHREPGPGTAVGVVRMPVDHPLLPLPVGHGLAVGSGLVRTREGQRGDTVVEFGGEGGRVGDGEGRHEQGRTVVGPLVRPVVDRYVRDVRGGGVRVRVRAVQPPPVGEVKRETVGPRLAARDPRHRLMGQRPPQAGQHGRPGTGEPGPVRRREVGAYGAQLVGERGLGIGHGGTVHGRAPWVRGLCVAVARADRHTDHQCTVWNEWIAWTPCPPCPPCPP